MIMKTHSVDEEVVESPRYIIYYSYIGIYSMKIIQRLTAKNTTISSYNVQSIRT